MNAASARGGLLTMLVWLAACGPTMDQSTPTEPAALGSGAYERSVRVEGLVHDYRLFVPSVPCCCRCMAAAPVRRITTR